jgi:hypothetical protein
MLPIFSPIESKYYSIAACHFADLVNQKRFSVNQIELWEQFATNLAEKLPAFFCLKS